MSSSLSGPEYVLVTGGAGFIGSHTCKALHQKGFLPVVLDSLTGGYEKFVQWGPFFKGDIHDNTLLSTILKKYKPKAILHFAGLINVGESQKQPDTYYHHNLEGTKTLLDSAISHGIPHFIFSSTAAVYGSGTNIDLTETSPLNPDSVYGQTKLEAERLIQEAEKTASLTSVIFRYFNAAGADPEGELGEKHVPETHLIPLIVQTLLGQRKKLSVFGDDYPTPDGTCIRDYVHVSDLAEAHVLGLKYLLKGGQSTLLNLGNGQGFSVKDVIEATEKVCGQKVPFTVTNRREGDPARLVASSQKAKTLLNWKPDYPDLESMILSCYDYLKQEKP